jgi:hypothetical protein
LARAPSAGAGQAPKCACAWPRGAEVAQPELAGLLQPPNRRARPGWLEDARRIVLSRWGVVLAATGAGGVALRIWAYRSPIGVPTSDDGVVGLMSLHAMHGEFTTFFWGQAYGGSQEALLTAPVFWLFGPSWLALRIVPMVLTALSALLLWRVGRRTIGEPGATAAAALFWIWPPFAIYKLTHQNGFYASDVFYAALLLLLSLRIVERPDRVRAGLFGLAFGLAFWQSSQIVPLALPIVVWTLWKAPQVLRQLWVSLPLAALGALPWILYNLHHDWQSLSVLDQGGGTYVHRFRVFLSPLLPMTLGLRVTWTQALILPHLLTDLAVAALAAGFLYGAIRTRRTNASVLYVSALCFPFIYALSNWTDADIEPRYLMALMPVLALLLAQLARRWSLAVVLLACAGAITVANLQRMNAYEVRPQTYPPANRSMAALVSTLDRFGIDKVYAGYEIAYRLDFQTKERIVSVMNKSPLVFSEGQETPLTKPGFIRWPAYDRIVRAGLHAFVFYRAEIPASVVVPVLRRHGYHAYPAGAYVVYVPASVH